jgi:hypothetical protein
MKIKNPRTTPSARTSIEAVAAPDSASAGGVSRQQMIAEAAYARWERRGFTHGGDLQDWLEAEAEIDRKPSTH